MFRNYLVGKRLSLIEPKSFNQVLMKGKIYSVNSIIMFTCWFTLIKTHRMFNTKSDLQHKLITFAKYEVSMKLSSIIINATQS